MLACIALMAAALAPSFGFIVDHCTHAADPHDHPHICAAHHVTVLPAVTLIVLAAVWVARVLVGALHAARGAVVAHRTRGALSRMSEGCAERGIGVLPFEEPQAFVVGTLRPALFVTRGLLAQAHSEHLAPVLAHEHAHLRRRDPLRRLVGSVALAFHLPGLAAWLERRLARTHEMAADAEAARELGDPERVARALVRLTRAQRRSPRMAIAFGASDVELRVATLLDRRPRHDRPGGAALVLAALLLFVTAGASANAVHHGVEIVLGLLS
jgi:beta-lactamase regulating signal transducer with metallopeptidase domain